MSLHFPLPKIRTFRFSLHTSRLSLHGEVRGHHCGAEIRNEFTLSIAKVVFALFVPPLSNGTSRLTSDRKPKTNDQILPSPIIGSAEALPILCVRYFWWEREIEIQRGREIDGSDVTVFALKLAMNLHFPLPKIRTFRFSRHTSRLSIHGEVTMVALKFAMSSHFPLPKFFSPSLFPLFQMARAAQRVIENPRHRSNFAQSYFVLPIEKLNQINTKNYWKKKKRLCVRWLGVINLTWENLQIAKHKSGRRSFSSADWFVLCDL